MIIRLRNLGVLEQAEIELNDFTIICGRNNTGKTYATYTIFGFLDFWRNSFILPVDDGDIQTLLDDGVVEIPLDQYIENYQVHIDEATREYIKALPSVFATSQDRFTDSSLEIEVDDQELKIRDTHQATISSANAERFSVEKRAGENKIIVTLLVEKEKVKIPESAIRQFIGESIKRVIYNGLFPDVFISSAERTGAAIFRRELDFLKNRFFEEMSSDKKINPIELFFKDYRDYPLPVKKNVDFMRELEDVFKKLSALKDKYPELIERFENIIGGHFNVTREGILQFIPTKTRIKLNIDESSSSVRSLLDIPFYVKHIAKPGDMLMIDEPELNLHPENQRLVARLLAELVNLGIKVFITTHSDYIIKELNTLIMLNQDKDYIKVIADKEGYRDKEKLSHKKISVYIAKKHSILKDGNKRKSDCQTLKKAEITPELGINAESFDDVIDGMNRIQDDILWGGDDD